MPLPGFSFGGGLSAGGGGPSSAGATTGVSGAGGISSPVVIGGFKSDGNATVLPVWLIATLAAGALFILWRTFKR